MTNPILDHLAEASALIISTWDIVITPYLTLGLQAHEIAEEEKTKEPAERTLLTMGGQRGIAYAFGNIEKLKCILTPEREHLIHSIMFIAQSDHWEWPGTLIQATDGFLEQDAYGPDDIWRMVSNLEGSDWSIAERLRCTLRQVKQARRVRDILQSAGSPLLEDWSDAVRKAVEVNLEDAGTDLATAYNQL